MKRQLIPIFVTVAIMGLGIFTAKPYLAAAPSKSLVKSNSSLISTSNGDINSFCRNSQKYLITYPHSPFWTWVNTECDSGAAITSLLAGEAKGIGVICAYAQHEISSAPSSQVSNREKIYANACTKPWVVPPPPENVITSDLQPGASLDMYDSNSWQGTVNGQNLTVFAGIIGASNGQGEYPNDSTTGDITTWSNTTARVVNTVQLPGSGMLTIESYSGDTLAVKSASGKSYTFNMVSGVLSAS